MKKLLQKIGCIIRGVFMALTKEGLISICDKVVEQKATITDLNQQLADSAEIVELFNDVEVITSYNEAIAIANE